MTVFEIKKKIKIEEGKNKKIIVYLYDINLIILFYSHFLRKSIIFYEVGRIIRCFLYDHALVGYINGVEKELNDGGIEIYDIRLGGIDVGMYDVSHFKKTVEEISKKTKMWDGRKPIFDSPLNVWRGLIFKVTSFRNKFILICCLDRSLHSFK